MIETKLKKKITGGSTEVTVYFLESRKVNAYPTEYRNLNYNAESDKNTEYNITNNIVLPKKTYFITEDWKTNLGTVDVSFVIDGYSFKFKKGSLTDEDITKLKSADIDCFAIIVKTQDLSFAPNQKTTILGNWYTGSRRENDSVTSYSYMLDPTISGTDVFTGLVFGKKSDIQGLNNDSENEEIFWLDLSDSNNERKIRTNDIEKSGIETINIKDQNVTTAKIKDIAVTTAKIKDKAVTTEKINTNAVVGDSSNDAGDGKIASDAISTRNIKNDAVVGDSTNDSGDGKIADNAISTRNIKSFAVTAEKILANSVTGDITEGDRRGKIADSAVSTRNILDNSISTIKLNTNSVAPHANRLVDYDVEYNKNTLTEQPTLLNITQEDGIFEVKDGHIINNKTYDLGTSNKPIYINKGKLTECETSQTNDNNLVKVITSNNSGITPISHILQFNYDGVNKFIYLETDDKLHSNADFDFDGNNISDINSLTATSITGTNVDATNATFNKVNVTNTNNTYSTIKNLEVAKLKAYNENSTISGFKNISTKNLEITDTLTVNNLAILPNCWKAKEIEFVDSNGNPLIENINLTTSTDETANLAYLSLNIGNTESKECIKVGSGQVRILKPVFIDQALYLNNRSIWNVGTMSINHINALDKTLFITSQNGTQKVLITNDLNKFKKDSKLINTGFSCEYSRADANNLNKGYKIKGFKNNLLTYMADLNASDGIYVANCILTYSIDSDDYQRIKSVLQTNVSIMFEYKNGKISFIISDWTGSSSIASAANSNEISGTAGWLERNVAIVVKAYSINYFEGKDLGVYLKYGDAEDKTEDDPNDYNKYLNLRGFYLNNVVKVK